MRYSYDKLNRLETVTACDNADCSAGDTTRYRYNKAGSRTAIEHANGSQTSYQYDNRHRLVELTTQDAFGQTIQSQRFTLGDGGHRLAVEEHGNRTVEYDYDALYRMTQERVTDPRGNRVTTYTFDTTGNRLSRTVSCDPTCNGEITAGTTSYSYDKNDRLLNETGPDGTTSYTYDDNGNTLEKTGPDGLVSYTYDADDRLIKATGALESSATETRYVYDVHGVRQSQWVDGQVTRFLVDPNRDYAQVIEELDASGAAEALYVFGHERISQDRNGTHSTYHADGLGSIRALIRLSGERTDRYDYNAYGQLEHSEGTTQNDFRSTGEQYDPNLGFYYLRARYYNPANGRFPTMDTYQGRIHEPQTLHKYLYVHGDPVNNIDPSGHNAIAEQGAVASMISTLSSIAVPNIGRVAVKRVFKRLMLAVGTAGIAHTGYRAVRKEAKEEARPELEAIVLAQAARRRGPLLFHYSDRASVMEIMATGSLRCSPEYRGHLGGGVTFPAGAYATDITPWTSQYTQASLQQAFFGGNRSRDVSWFVAIDGEEFYRYHQRQWVRQCPAGNAVGVQAYAFGPNLMDP